MAQFKTDVYINGNFFDTFWSEEHSPEDAEEKVLESDLVIEMETEEV